MQPVRRKDLEAMLASAKRDGRERDVAHLEARLKNMPPEPEPPAAPPQAPQPERQFEKHFVSLGPPENHERDRRLLDDKD